MGVQGKPADEHYCEADHRKRKGNSTDKKLRLAAGSKEIATDDCTSMNDDCTSDHFHGGDLQPAMIPELRAALPQPPKLLLAEGFHRGLTPPALGSYAAE